LGKEGRWGEKIWDKVREGGRQGARERVKEKKIWEKVKGPWQGCEEGGVKVILFHILWPHSII